MSCITFCPFLEREVPLSHMSLLKSCLFRSRFRSRKSTITVGITPVMFCVDIMFGIRILANNCELLKYCVLQQLCPEIPLLNRALVAGIINTISKPLTYNLRVT